MEILYEPYHIGIKLHPYTVLEVLKEKLKRELERRSYEIPREVITGPPIIKIGVPEEIIASKEEVKIIMMMDLQALNTRGTSPINVSNVFKEITNILPLLGYELDALVQFYEIIAIMNVKTTKKPAEIFKKAIKIRPKAMFGTLGEVETVGVHINVKREGRGPMDLIIEPNPTSPTSRLYIRLVFRSKDKTEVESFYKELEENIGKMIGSLDKV